MSCMRRPALLALGATVMLLGPLSGPRLAAQSGRAAPPSLIPFPSRPDKPFSALSRAILAGRDSLVHLSRQQVGLRYRYGALRPGNAFRSEEHTSELQSHSFISYAV